MPLSIKMVRGRMTWSMTKVINILMHSSCLVIYLSIPLLLSIILGHSTLLLLDLPLSPYYFWCPICNILIPSHFIVCILINLTKFPFFNVWSIGLYVLYIWIVNNICASHRHSLTTGYLYYFPSEWTQLHFHFKSDIIYNQEEVSEAQGRDGYHNG